MPNRTAFTALAATTVLTLATPTALAEAAPSAEPSAISEGTASWTALDTQLAPLGLTFDVTKPATEAVTAETPATTGTLSFPAVAGTLTPEPQTPAGEVKLGGAVRIGASNGQPPLILAGLTLTLTGDRGTLQTRTALDGRARQLTLARITTATGAPTVKKTSVTWTALKAELTSEGAELLSTWSGQTLSAGGDLGVLDVTVGTPESAPSEAPVAEEPPTGSTETEQRQQGEEKTAPQAAVSLTHPTLLQGSQQQLTGTEFTPGTVVLVAIDGDTRYQATADEEGRFELEFPVYASAAPGAHEVVVTDVTGQLGALNAEFEVNASSG